MKKENISKKTANYLPKYQRTKAEEARAEADAQKYRIEKTGSIGELPR